MEAENGISDDPVVYDIEDEDDHNLIRTVVIEPRRHWLYGSVVDLMYSLGFIPF